LTEELKFKTSLSVSPVLSVKFCAEAILPKTNGVSKVFIANIINLLETYQIVTYFLVCYLLV
jgi:hypothetical protein